MGTELRLTADAHKADRKLWLVERRHLEAGAAGPAGVAEPDKDRRIAQDALNAAEAVQKQYAESHRFYTGEVGRLNARIQELTNLVDSKEAEFQRKANEASPAPTAELTRPASAGRADQDSGD